MKQRILVFGFAVLAMLSSTVPVQAAGKHLIVVHSKDNTGEGVVTVNKASLHPVPPLGVVGAGECSKAVCGKTYATGTRVTLTATPAPGSTFTGWGGDCAGTSPTCVVRMRTSLDVMVHFSK